MSYAWSLRVELVALARRNIFAFSYVSGETYLDSKEKLCLKL